MVNVSVTWRIYTWYRKYIQMYFAEYRLFYRALLQKRPISKYICDMMMTHLHMRIYTWYRRYICDMMMTHLHVWHSDDSLTRVTYCLHMWHGECICDVAYFYVMSQISLWHVLMAHSHVWHDALYVTWWMCPWLMCLYTCMYIRTRSIFTGDKMDISVTWWWLNYTCVVMLLYVIWWMYLWLICVCTYMYTWICVFIYIWIHAFIYTFMYEYAHCIYEYDIWIHFLYVTCQM